MPIGKPLKGHTQPVYSLAFAAVDGARRFVIVSGSNDKGGHSAVGCVHGRAGCGKPLQSGHTEAVYSLAFGVVDGRPVIVSGGADKTIRLWNARTGATDRQIAGETHR